MTAVELTQQDLELIKTTVDPERIETVWVGDTVTTDIVCDLQIGDEESGVEAVDRMKALLQDKGIIFRPW